MSHVVFEPPADTGIGIGTTAIASMGILLGTIPLFKDALVDHLSASGISLGRVAIAFLAIAVVALIRGQSIAIKWRHIWFFVGYGLISVAAVNFLYIKSLTCTSTAVASVTVFVFAPLTTLVGGWLIGAKTDTRHTYYILLIIVGCIFVNVDSQATENSQHVMGIGYAALCGVFFGLFSLFGKKLTQDYDSVAMMFWQFFIAAGATMGAVIIFEPKEITAIMQLPSVGIYAIIGIGVVATFIPYYLYSYGLKRNVPPSTASALTLLEPVSAIILMVLFAGEQITFTQTIGVGIVLYGSTLISKRSPARGTRGTLPE